MSPTLTELNTEHEQFEAHVVEWLSTHGWCVEDLTYHNRLSTQLKNILIYRNSPTALAVRSRADRISICLDYPVEFFLEIKTTLFPQHQNIALEAFPLAIHALQAKHGIRCLYVHRHATTKKECGFWVHQLPPLREIRIPRRWDNDTTLWFRSVFESIFPAVPVIDTPSRGSGDPFAIIDASVVKTLPHWKRLVIDLTARFSLS